jgi:V8-like Glu-specific endopeptidase
MFHRDNALWQANRNWRRWAGMGAIVCGMLLLLQRHVGADSAQSVAAATAASAGNQSVSAEPCLPNDPYQLAELNRVIASDSPPSSPVMINRFIKITFIGKGTLVEQPQDLAAVDPHFLPPTAPGQPNPQERDEEVVPAVDSRIRVFNTRTGNEFEIELAAAMLDAIHECRTAAGLNAGTLGVDDPMRTESGYPIYLPMVTRDRQRQWAASGAHQAPLARSDGLDSRIIRAPTTTWPWRAIAQLDSGCTGTLVGPRHVITVAHCINRFGTNTWFSFTVRPGRDGNTVPYGSSTISPNVPAGQEAWYFTHPQWRNPNSANPWQWDWGFIVIPDRLGDATGWMGYYAFTASVMRQVDHLNRGYPACWSTRPDTPVGCQTSRLYGDTNVCRLGNFSSPGPDGWNRQVFHSCDTSAGHSGSAFYRWVFDPTLNKDVPGVVGVHNASLCDRDVDNDGTVEASEICDASDDYPSVVRRNTPTELDIISFFREQFP